jgi:hypothetical protein
MKIPESQLRKLVRDQLILEQEGGGGDGASSGESIAELIKKVPKKALIKVLGKGFKNPVTSVKIGKFYMDGEKWDSLVNFMAEKLQGEEDAFGTEEEVLKYINDNADKLIGFGVEHYNQENPDDEPVTLEHANPMKLTQIQLREIIREALLKEQAHHARG